MAQFAFPFIVGAAWGASAVLSIKKHYDEDNEIKQEHANRIRKHIKTQIKELKKVYDEHPEAKYKIHLGLLELQRGVERDCSDFNIPSQRADQLKEMARSNVEIALLRMGSL